MPFPITYATTTRTMINFSLSSVVRGVADSVKLASPYNFFAGKQTHKTWYASTKCAGISACELSE